LWSSLLCSCAEARVRRQDVDPVQASASHGHARPTTSAAEPEHTPMLGSDRVGAQRMAVCLTEVDLRRPTPLMIRDLYETIAYSF
jgi:hypothetical protein